MLKIVQYGIHMKNKTAIETKGSNEKYAKEDFQISAFWDPHSVECEKNLALKSRLSFCCQ